MPINSIAGDHRCTFYYPDGSQCWMTALLNRDRCQSHPSVAGRLSEPYNRCVHIIRAVNPVNNHRCRVSMPLEEGPLCEQHAREKEWVPVATLPKVALVTRTRRALTLLFTGAHDDT